MPYIVSRETAGRLERVYCETAAKAIGQHRVWNASGADVLRVTSVEGAEMPVERLATLARSEFPATRTAA